MGRVVIDAVLFDGDDTVWDFRSSRRTSLRLVLEELWSRRPSSVDAGLDVDRLIEIRSRVANELAGRVLDPGALQLAAFEQVLEETGEPDPELASELTSSYFGHRERTVKVVDGAEQLLEELSVRYRLGLVTRIDPSRYGLGRFFEVVVEPASDLETEHLIIGRAVAALGFPGTESAPKRLSDPHRVCFVGSSTSGLRPAAATFGLVPVWLRHGEPEGLFDIEFSVGSLDELGVLLESRFEPSDIQAGSYSDGRSQ